MCAVAYSHDETEEIPAHDQPAHDERIQPCQADIKTFHDLKHRDRAESDSGIKQPGPIQTSVSNPVHIRGPTMHWP